jgi:hypothetical protein
MRRFVSILTTIAFATTAYAERQSLDDAWWTGPIIAAGAGTLPKGRYLIEPYLYQAISYDRFDADGNRQDTPRARSLGSLTYMLYGLTDDITVGLIPRFGYNDISNGKDSSGVGLGDTTLQAQYRLTRFKEGSWIPTTSLVLQETLPTGKYDQLGDRVSDGLGSGSYTTTVALYSQSYFWMPTGRILRTRFNVSYSFSDSARVEDASVYGTGDGFRGDARPGDSLAINLSGEYSLTRNWVLAMDLLYQHDDKTRVSSSSGATTFPTSERFGVVPAVEYNWNSRVGVIVGARWIGAGRNADATITPVTAINMVF